MSRRTALLAGAAVVAVAAVVAAGRWERSSAAAAQVHGIEGVLALVGPKWATTATAYRLAPTHDCLLYRVGDDPYALELCFDARGRVVQAVDRRGTGSRLWTLAYDPGESSLREDPAKVVAVFVGARAAPKGTTTIPLGHFDVGPIRAGTPPVTGATHTCRPRTHPRKHPERPRRHPRNCIPIG